MKQLIFQIFLLFVFSCGNTVEEKDNSDESFLLSFNNEDEVLSMDFKSWKEEGTTAYWNPYGGIGNSPCLIIENTEINDSLVYFDPKLEQGQWYTLSGWVKGYNIDHYEDFNFGPNICVKDTWSVTYTENYDKWKKLLLTFKYEENLEIALRLGFWWGTATGKAYFDDIYIQEHQFSYIEGNNIRFLLDHEDINEFSEDDLNLWVDNLDKVYTLLEIFTGFTPFNGDVMEIVSVEHYPGGAAVAGQPIYWMKEFVRDQVNDVVNNNDWSFAMVHEISHNFDHEYWNFDAEHFSNIKLCYAIESLNGVVQNHNKEFATGQEVEEIFYYKKNEVLNYYLNTGEFYDFNDLITYWFLRFKDITGWANLSKTFKYYIENDINVLDRSRFDQFLFFIETYEEISGEQLLALIPAQELEAIKVKYSE